MSGPEIVLAALLGLLLLAAGAAYNGLIRRRNRVDATWSDIDVLLSRRHDLVPSLVTSVRGYAGHESAAMRQTAELRAAAVSAQGPASAANAESALTAGVKALLATAEAYPALKASRAFVELQDQLAATEDGIEHARQFYNDAVFGYNNAVQTLPRSLVAAALGFRPREFFRAQGGERLATPVRL